MDKVFILHPSNIDSLQLKDAIHERINKAKAITNFVLANIDSLINPTIYHLIWIVDSG